MTENIILLLAWLGGIVIIAVVIFLVIMFVNWLKEKADEARLNHMIKHRFDKPPTAKCYCRDCVYYGRNGYGQSDRCCYLERGVADNWFCYHAEPIKHERADESGTQPQREDV